MLLAALVSSCVPISKGTRFSGGRFGVGADLSPPARSRSRHGPKRLLPYIGCVIETIGRWSILAPTPVYSHHPLAPSLYWESLTQRFVNHFQYPCTFSALAQSEINPGFFTPI